ncbi:DUF2946 family protein [Deinococcus aquaticus]|uniref:DUF2946 family protein n=1 Tax=Deinococcus aquaticus TaxID=328692 RepID=UPI0036096891
MRRRSLGGHLQRTLLTVLTLCASLLYLTRVETPAPPVSAGGHQGHMGQGHVGGPAAGTPTTPGRPEQSHAPGGHGTGGHGAHCPFCFTGGFALEPGLPLGIRVQPREAQVLIWRSAPARWRTVRHADPRAPPRARRRSHFAAPASSGRAPGRITG